MKILKITLVLLLGLSLAACCACRKGKKVIDKPLLSTQWTLVELYGQPVTTDDNYYIVLDPQQGRFNGRGDCNSLMGSYVLGSNGKLGGNGTIELTGIASTRAFCPDQTREDLFFKTLEAVKTYDVDGDLLMLFNDKSELIAVLAAKIPVDGNGVKNAQNVKRAKP